jgi:hypothetical protein
MKAYTTAEPMPVLVTVAYPSHIGVLPTTGPQSHSQWNDAHIANNLCLNVDVDFSESAAGFTHIM